MKSRRTNLSISQNCSNTLFWSTCRPLATPFPSHQHPKRCYNSGKAKAELLEGAKEALEEVKKYAEEHSDEDEDADTDEEEEELEEVEYFQEDSQKEGTEQRRRVQSRRRAQSRSEAQVSLAASTRP